MRAKKQSEVVFQSLYQQDPQPRKGLLYKELMEYDKLPQDDRAIIKARVDSADSGEDYLCSVVYLESEKRAFILDVIYSKEGSEITEGQVAQQFDTFKVNEASIESNAGGRYFARNVERLLHEMDNTLTTVHWFHQSENKVARIFSQASNVQNSVYFPEYWGVKFPEFHRDVTGYLQEGKNKNDDGPDTLTGIVEDMGTGGAKFY